MGRGQVVRQRVLVPVFGGSNPFVPGNIHCIRVKVYFENNVMFKCLILDIIYFRILNDSFMNHIKSPSFLSLILYPLKLNLNNLNLNGVVK